MTTTTPNIILDGHKLAWHRERIEAWQRGERIAPITIDCALTRACTYKCEYCYAVMQMNEPKRMTREVIYDFLDDCAEIGVKGVSFVSDGESTLNPYCSDAIVHGHRNGLDMAIGTNGYLLEDHRLDELLNALTYMRINSSAGERDRYAEIMGCPVEAYDKVVGTIKKAVDLKRKHGYKTTIGLQMVLLPHYEDQIIPLVKLGAELGVDYTVIKHCSDDENGQLGVDYSKYQEMVDVLRHAETFSTEHYLVKVKWSKILSGGKRNYSQCYGPPFILQMSGSGLVAPCGMLFNDKYHKYHIGNICDTRFKDIWQSERYWEVMDLIASEAFDARTMCGTLCLQHKVNECLWSIKTEGYELDYAEGADEAPMHVNFI